MSLCQPLKLNLLGCFTSHLLPSLQSLLATCFLCFFRKLFDSPLQPQLYQPTCPQQMHLQLLGKAPASHLNDIVATQSAVLLSSASSQYLICLTLLLAGIRSSQWTLTLILIDRSDIDLLWRCAWTTSIESCLNGKTSCKSTLTGDRNSDVLPAWVFCWTGRPPCQSSLLTLRHRLVVFCLLICLCDLLLHHHPLLLVLWGFGPEAGCDFPATSLTSCFASWPGTPCAVTRCLGLNSLRSSTRHALSCMLPRLKDFSEAVLCLVHICWLLPTGTSMYLFLWLVCLGTFACQIQLMVYVVPPEVIMRCLLNFAISLFFIASILVLVAMLII